MTDAHEGDRAPTVLLVEDNPGDATLVRLMLEEIDPECRLVCVDRLSAAWEHLPVPGDGLVLLDLSLPDADGLDGVERIRAASPGLAIIVLTGRDDLDVAVEAVRRGAQDYLVKGRVDGHLLVRSMRYAIARKRVEAQLSHQALHDPLTALPNRALFVDRLEQALVRGERRPGCVAVLFLDLDRFKVVNDSLGHSAGDRLLVGVAARLLSVLRPSDTVARFGGDEFTVLCADLASAEEPILIADRVAAALAAPFDLDGAEVVLTASVGIAVSEGPDDSPEQLIGNADAAMYRAKERGRARWMLFDEGIHRRAVDRLETEVALRRAIERDELRLVYQPLVHPDSGAVAGFEALLRWDHPSRGLVLPGTFVALAEETGLIEPIGVWVIEEACRQARRWRDGAFATAPLVVSVNVSARQLARGALPATVAEALSASRLNPDDLCLEITESALIEDVDATSEALTALRGMGVRLAVDDFGTGYTSLGNLKRFPVDMIKVDRTFIGGLGRDRGDAAITMTVVRLARALGLTTVAEGVETAEQLEALRTIGCDLVQGYLVGPPRSAAQVVPRAAVGLSQVGG